MRSTHRLTHQLQRRRRIRHVQIGVLAVFGAFAFILICGALSRALGHEGTHAHPHRPNGQWPTTSAPPTPAKP